MTSFDELLASIDANKPAQGNPTPAPNPADPKTDPKTDPAQTVGTQGKTAEGEHMMPIGDQFKAFCDSRKKK